ncbi:MAG: phospho-sugar mutase [Firmicutes bacterium]|nr:phospho-sugar mutase [Bacillota bacterium]
MTAAERYQIWCAKATEDADLVTELKEMSGNDAEIAERFSTDLVFGTGGLRGVIGAGTSLMNIYTVRRATQGLADYILQSKPQGAAVAIAYDSRIKSELFSKEAAAVLAGNGIHAYIYPELMPTPMLSYAVRALGAQGGINVTASHNPSKYNGYKVYGADGCQLTDAAAGAVFRCIEKVDLFADVKRVDFEQGIAQNLISLIGEDVQESYLDAVQKQSVHQDVCKKAGLKVIYTPLNGAGNKPVRAIMKRVGVEHVAVVPEQEKPDGRFPTCPYPNPEIRQVFECGLKMAQQDEPDLLLATDPDSDRVGIAARDGDDYRLFTGNEVGAMLLNYILSQRAALGTLPKNPIAVKTIVTTPIIYAIAKKYGCEVVDVLTGFKYIGEKIGELEKTGEEDRYVLGFEESYGYLAGSYVRDKDAVFASMMICEMAAFYKLQGKSLVDVINDIYREFGYYINSVSNFECSGLAGMQKMQEIMNALRTDAPAEIGGVAVESVADYYLSEKTTLSTGAKTKIDLPKSNVLSYMMAGGANVVVRPSGTEPKIKVYVAASGKTKDAAETLSKSLLAAVTKLMGF